MAWKWRPKHYTRDGVNTLKYKRLKLELRPLYTWLYCEVAPPPRIPRMDKGASETGEGSGFLAAWSTHEVIYWGAILACVIVGMVQSARICLLQKDINKRYAMEEKFHYIL